MNITDPNLLLPIAGAGIGGMATGTPSGAMVGMSLGSAGAAALGMGQEAPQIPGASASQKQLLAVQQGNIEKQQSQSGLSSQEVNRIAQLGTEQMRQSLANIRAIPTAMPLLAQQRLGKALIEQSKGITDQVGKKVQMLDPLAEAERIKATSMMTAQAGQQASEIQRAEVQAEIYKQKMEQQKNANFIKALKASGAALIAYDEMAKATGDEAKAVEQYGKYDDMNISHDEYADAWGLNEDDFSAQARYDGMTLEEMANKYDDEGMIEGWMS